MTMATADTDNVIPLQTGPASEPQPGPSARPKDATSALRSKRYRRSRKRDGRDGKPAHGRQTPQTEEQNEIKRRVTVVDAPPLVPDTGVHGRLERHGRRIDMAAYVA